MPRRKTTELKTDPEKRSSDDANSRISKGKSQAARKKTKNEFDSKIDSKKSEVVKTKTAHVEEKSTAVTRFKGRKNENKMKEKLNPIAKAAFEDNCVSEYFSASQENPNSSTKSRGGKKKYKTDNNSSFASKIKTLKDEGSTEGSDIEFETAVINYRSPSNKKNKASKKLKSDEKQVSTTSEVNDGKVDNEDAGMDSVCNKKDTNAYNKGRNVPKANKGKDDKPSKVTTSRKRQNCDLGAPNEGDEIVTKKPKRETRGNSKITKKCPEKNNVSVKRNAKKKSKQIEEVNKNKATTRKTETENALTILQHTEGNRLKNNVANKSCENNSYEISDEEDMMDVVESVADNDAVDADVRPLPKSVDHSDAMAVLMHMEGPKPSVLAVIPSTSKPASNVAETVSDDDVTDESDWEDVEEHHGNSPKKSQLPSGPVEITLEAPVIYKKRKKGEFDIQAYFRRQTNKFKREVAMDIHKVHLLCLLSRCQYLNGLCNDETVQAQALSLALVTKELKVPKVKSCMESHVTQVLSWIKEKKQYLAEVMSFGLNGLSAQLRITLICVIILRQVGFLTRLLMSLQPVPFKETSNKKGKSPKNFKGKAIQKSQQNSASTKTVTTKGSKKSNSKIKTTKVKSEKTEAEKDSKEVQRRSTDRKCSKVSKTAYKDQNNSDEELLSDDDNFKPDDNDDDSDGEEDGGKRKKSGKKSGKRKRTSVKASVKEEKMSDDDFEEDSILIRTQQLKKEPSVKKNRRALSSDNESDDISGVDNWAEVYLQKEQRWICIDCVAVQVKKPYEVENKATQPISYVVGVTQEGYMRDATARYASQWLTETRKVRVDSEWWQETLEPYICPNKQRNKIEDEELNSHLQQRPLPTSVGGFKSHPLYALRRHLLKFEAIHPDSAIPVGYIKGEPVYARECVHTLHSRENWLKEGRAVRIGEEAYKFVKSRPKWNRPKEDPEAKDLEVFGQWQTELYIPPPAVDGKVPRNAHGNVEMFLPSMLPAGTVHLKIAGLNKVAKKLDIDCAPAMIGWDHHCGFSHPLMDGWIVCEEHKDILLAAWDEEQEIIREKEQQKRVKRVYDNWRKLIRGMLIKERLKKRFDLEEKPEEKKTEEPDKVVAGTSQSADDTRCQTPPPSVKEGKAGDKKLAWPQNRINGEQYTFGAIEKI